MYFEDLEKQYLENGKMFHEFVCNRFHDLLHNQNLVNEQAAVLRVSLKNTIAFLNEHVHHFRNLALTELRRTYGGVCDKSKLVHYVYNRLQNGIMHKYLATFVYNVSEFDKVNWDAYKFAIKYSRDVVNWLGQNVCIDKYDLLVTKKAYKRVKKLVQLVEDKDSHEPELVIMPKQWNLQGRGE